MIKLKSILSEGYAWEREAGKPLPTLEQTTAAHAAKQAEQSAEQALSNPIEESNHDFVADCADYFSMTAEEFEQQVMRSGAEFDVIERILNSSMSSEEAYALVADMVNLPQPSNEAAEGVKPDYIDADGDGDEQESMKKAFADKADKEDVTESFNRRLMGNLKGSEHILSETFRK
jgi:hypothetical protein